MTDLPWRKTAKTHSREDEENMYTGERIFQCKEDDHNESSDEMIPTINLQVTKNLTRN